MELALRQWTEHALAGLGARVGFWEPLKVEASHRRFFRTGTPEHSFVVMASPPALENNAQFVALAALFGRHGVGVPRLLAREDARGFFLMTDLGSRHFADVYADTGPAAVMPAAIDTLVRLQAIRDPGIPPYTRQRFRDELGIYREWFLGRLLGQAAPAGLDEAFEPLLSATRAQPTCCVHRDFHCRNLLVDSQQQVGVVDFQDALMGPATYDLASLLRDCYYTFPEAEVARWRDVYVAASDLPLDRATFAHDMDLTALQRQLKAVGIFARLHLRDGRASHLGDIVPVLERVGDLAAVYGTLAPLADHVSRILPLARKRLAELPCAP